MAWPPGAPGPAAVSVIGCSACGAGAGCGTCPCLGGSAWDRGAPAEEGCGVSSMRGLWVQISAVFPFFMGKGITGLPDLSCSIVR